LSKAGPADPQFRENPNKTPIFAIEWGSQVHGTLIVNRVCRYRALRGSTTREEEAVGANFN
jgi:hypothetical protein